MTPVDDSFILEAINSFVDESLAVSNQVAPDELKKLDGLISQLEERLASSSSKNSIEVTAMLPVVVSNTKELMKAVSQARSLSSWHTEAVLTHVGGPNLYQESAKDAASLREEVARLKLELKLANERAAVCPNCDKLLGELARLTAENGRLKEIAKCENRSPSPPLTARIKGLPSRKPHDGAAELRELETALAAVEGIKTRIDRITHVKL